MRADLPGPETLLVDVAGAAILMGTTPKAVRQRVARRLLPFRKLGGRVVFIRTELERFLAALPGCSIEEAETNVMERSREGVAR